MFWLYRIAGIFHGGKYSFFIKKSIFVCFIFVFASSAPFYNTGSHTQFVKLFFGLILEQKKRKLNPTKITRYTVHVDSSLYLLGH